MEVENLNFGLQVSITVSHMNLDIRMKKTQFDNRSKCLDTFFQNK